MITGPARKEFVKWFEDKYLKGIDGKFKIYTIKPKRTEILHLGFDDVAKFDKGVMRYYITEWFREVHGIHIFAYKNESGYYAFSFEGKHKYDNYNEAIDQAISYAMELYAK